MANLLAFFKSSKPQPLIADQDSADTKEAEKAKGAKDKNVSLNPYVEARREWNERYGDYISQAHNWRLLAFISALVSLCAVCGIAYIGSQNKIVPYVVQVDKFGSAVASGPADKASAVDTRVVKAFLGRFVADWRSLTTDRVAQKEAVLRVYALLSLGSSGHKKMNEYFEANNPFVRLQQGTVAIEVTSALAISDKTWQVEWTEISRNFKGEVESKVRYKASLIVGIKPPTQESQIMVNPLGVFIMDFNVAQQL